MVVKMSWFDRFFSSTVADENRWIVLDVETSGLDPYRDRLLAIAALAIQVDHAKQKITLDLSDSFEAVLRQDEVSDKDNILLHGIGAHAQRSGQDPVLVLSQFRDWVGNSPLFAFHAAFDEAMIQRAYQYFIGKKIKNLWIDIEPLAAASYPQIKARTLDQWMAYFGIQCAVRHQAAADTFATAELLMQIWPQLRPLASNCRALSHLARQSRWIPRT